MFLQVLLVRRDRGGEPDARAPAARRRDRERRGVQHEAQHLRLGRRRVADHEQVDVPADVRPVREVLLRAAEQEEHEKAAAEKCWLPGSAIDAEREFGDQVEGKNQARLSESLLRFWRLR